MAAPCVNQLITCTVAQFLEVSVATSDNSLPADDNLQPQADDIYTTLDPDSSLCLDDLALLSASLSLGDLIGQSDSTSFSDDPATLHTADLCSQGQGDSLILGQRPDCVGQEHSPAKPHHHFLPDLPSMLDLGEFRHVPVPDDIAVPRSFSYQMLRAASNSSNSSKQSSSSTSSSNANTSTKLSSSASSLSSTCRSTDTPAQHPDSDTTQFMDQPLNPRPAVTKATKVKVSNRKDLMRKLKKLIRLNKRNQHHQKMETLAVL